jgi:hypothetical protein
VRQCRYDGGAGTSGVEFVWFGVVEAKLNGKGREWKGRDTDQRVESAIDCCLNHANTIIITDSMKH